MLLGLFALTCAFLWALATGLLGRRPGLARADWPVLAALLVALAARLLLARLSNSDVTLYFSPPPLDWLLADKHSVVYPSFKLLAFLAMGDPLGGLTSLNAVCGAATVVPLYLFVLRRTGVRLAAMAAAVLREPCAGFEAAVELAPVEEIVNDVREGYDDPALPTRARLGLYRVVGMR
jgi:hypothetical protein